MTGCEACSALVAAGDAFCATCGAELRPARRRPAGPATGRVEIPVRRYGRAPQVPRSLRSTDGKHAARRRLVLLAALLAPAVAAAVAVTLVG